LPAARPPPEASTYLAPPWETREVREENTGGEPGLKRPFHLVGAGPTAKPSKLCPPVTFSATPCRRGWPCQNPVKPRLWSPSPGTCGLTTRPEPGGSGKRAVRPASKVLGCACIGSGPSTSAGFGTRLFTAQQSFGVPSPLPATPLPRTPGRAPVYRQPCSPPAQPSTTNRLLAKSCANTCGSEPACCHAKNHKNLRAMNPVFAPGACFRRVFFPRVECQKNLATGRIAFPPDETSACSTKPKQPQALVNKKRLPTDEKNFALPIKAHHFSDVFSYAPSGPPPEGTKNVPAHPQFVALRGTRKEPPRVAWPRARTARWSPR